MFQRIVTSKSPLICGFIAAFCAFIYLPINGRNEIWMTFHYMIIKRCLILECVVAMLTLDHRMYWLMIWMFFDYVINQ
ncbi:unnamed protein product [Callosobruchus maculatus]|uniref:Uncharacterized protein n=1 Tax=Callosobruchus maculatus TaxID=64391 RepID=A0A653BME3_CALMS|nr:unnamed protein product [Callosobruchus maculatus]